MQSPRCPRMQEKLERGEFCWGTHISTTDIGFYEVAALMGADYVWIDTEHALVNTPALVAGMALLQARGVSALVRVAKCDDVLAKPYLDNGADGIVFPMVNTPEQAALAVAACRYPPKGNRGYGPLRAGAYGGVLASEQIDNSDREVMPVIQIEHHLAVERLDQILSVEGVRWAVLGPMDLSLSVGKPGRLDDPEVSQLIETTFDKCARYGVKLGVSMGIDRAFFKRVKDRGAAFASLGNPYAFCKYAIGELILKT